MKEGGSVIIVTINVATFSLDSFPDMSESNFDQTDLDIVDVINAVLPFEKHFPGCHYLGPGTRLDLRLDQNGNPYPGSEPVDRVDEAALKHDKAYNRFGDLRNRLNADKEMLFDLYNIQNPTRRERMETCLTVPILLIKRFFGNMSLKLMSLFALISSCVTKLIFGGE